ncbi:MAG: DUF4852 domain-containing protein [Thermoanaerobaculia bacterium]
MSCKRQRLAGSLLLLIYSPLSAQYRAPQAHPPSRTTVHAVPTMSREKAFFFLVKGYKQINDIWIDIYGTTFDSFNYKRSTKDEFERDRYRTATRSVIDRGVAAADFTTKFSATGSGKLGEYDFSRHQFPITSWSFGTEYFFDGPGGQAHFRLWERNAVNMREFDAILQMDSDSANRFVKMRQLPDGEVDRTIYIRSVYSVLDEIPNREFMFGSYLYSIEIFADHTLTNRLAVLLPKREYADKIHGIEQLDGRKTIYYKGRYSANWSTRALSPTTFGELPSKEGAEIYREIDYNQGKIVSVKDYYVTGELEMEGHYLPYCADSHCANGLFTWYYKNGYKRQEETFANGTETPFCVKHFVDLFAILWDENGKCHTECPCTDQTAPAH